METEMGKIRESSNSETKGSPPRSMVEVSEAAEKQESKGKEMSMKAF